MADWNLSSPLLSGLEILECVAQVGGTATYTAMDPVTKREYVLKHISVPESQTQIDGLKYSGAVKSDEEAKAYYERVVENYRTELELLRRLSEHTNVAAYRACDVQEKAEGIGYDLYLLADRRQTLEEYMEKTPMTQLKAANLALDLCGALADLRKAGLLHADVKPGNILLNNKGHFMLGDLGLYRIDQLKFAPVTDRILSNYAAPELFSDVPEMNPTLDIYAVGSLLYHVYNGGHAPFEDERTTGKDARARRIAGDPMPAPLYADYEMTGIILKACAFRPEDRYQTPEELRQALTDYVKRNDLPDDIIVPPLVAGEDLQVSEDAMEETIEPIRFAHVEELEEKFIEHFSPDTTIQEEAEAQDAPAEAETPAEGPADQTAEDVEAPAEESGEEAAPTAEDPPADEPHQTPETPEAQPKKKKSRVWIWITAGVLVVAAALAALYFLTTPDVLAVEVADCATDSFTLALDLGGTTAEVRGVATDTYGNAYEAVSSEGGLTFTGLDPGTQYTVRLTAADGRGVRGVSTVSVTTEMTTEILYFVTRPVIASQVELNFNTAGADHDDWVVTVSAEGTPDRTIPFSGHSVTVTDLAADTLYRFTLSCPDGTLTGETELTYDTTVRVTVDELAVRYDPTTHDLVLRWDYTGEAPEAWTVNCYDGAGGLQTQSVATPTATFADLAEDSAYTAEIYCDGMPAPATRVIYTTGVTVSDLTAEASEGETVLAWTADRELEDTWVVVCRLISDTLEQELTFETAEPSVSLTGLLPGAEYEAEVQTASGVAVSGTSSVRFTAPDPSRFSSYGLSSVYLGFFLRPEKETWSARDLSRSRSSYSADEGVAFALEAMSSIRSSSDSVTVTLLVRDDNGALIDFQTQQAVWNDLWEGRLFVGALERTPQAPGTYTLQILMNGGLVTSKTFRVE